MSLHYHMGTQMKGIYIMPTWTHVRRYLVVQITPIVRCYLAWVSESPSHELTSEDRPLTGTSHYLRGLERDLCL